jgi:ABC-2 type transport system permease protein
MTGYGAFVKKELLESWKTPRALVLLAVFFLFGMMSPLLAKLMPEIMSGVDLAGLVIQIPEPTVMDAYGQFFKNLTQMGMIVFLLVFGGMLSQEIARGTLINMLTKGLSRSAVILAKFSVSLLLWTVALGLACATTYGYTVWLFKDGTADNLLFALFCLWLFGAFILALILLSSTLVRGSLGGLGLTAGFLIVLLLLGISPGLVKWNPVSLASQNVQLMAGTVTVRNLIPAVWVTFSASIVFLGAAVLVFRKNKL